MWSLWIKWFFICRCLIDLTVPSIIVCYPRNWRDSIYIVLRRHKILKYYSFENTQNNNTYNIVSFFSFLMYYFKLNKDDHLNQRPRKSGKATSSSPRFTSRHVLPTYSVHHKCLRLSAEAHERETPRSPFLWRIGKHWLGRSLPRFSLIFRRHSSQWSQTSRKPLAKQLWLENPWSGIECSSTIHSAYSSWRIRYIRNPFRPSTVSTKGRNSANLHSRMAGTFPRSQ